MKSIKQYIPKELKKILLTAKDFVNFAFYGIKKKALYFSKFNIIEGEELVNKICDKNLSMARFGDGEIRWMLNIHHISFEKYSDKMADKLKEVILADDPRIMICIPRTINSSKYCEFKPRMFWVTFWGKHAEKILPYLLKEKIYGDTEITRPYIDYKDKSKCINNFVSVKKLWNNRDVCIIEGKNTKLGVGNDLFDNTKSVKRILCPNVNAFEKYDDILKTVLNCNFSKDILFLTALGPTATILSYDLTLSGYQALDVGHIDIEYEWCLMGAKEKETIIGKAMSEGCETILTQDEDLSYKESILHIIL